MTLLKTPMFSRYTITLQFRTSVVGGVPANPKMIEAWLRANMKSADDKEIAELLTKTLSELPQMADEKATNENKWNTFKRMPLDGKEVLCLEGRQVKSMFKECANILRDLLIQQEAKTLKGEEKKVSKSRFTALKSKLAERLFVEEIYIPLLRNGSALLEPDGSVAPLPSETTIHF